MCQPRHCHSGLAPSSWPITRPRSAPGEVPVLFFTRSINLCPHPDVRRDQSSFGGRVSQPAPKGIRDRIGGWGRRLKACSVVAGGKRSAAPGWCRHRTSRPRRGRLFSAACTTGRICDPCRVEWNRCWSHRGRRPASAGLAHGYYRSAFQAVTAYGDEVA